MLDRILPRHSTAAGELFKASPRLRLLAWNGVVVIAYCLAGRLGQLLAVPPNYAAAVWPPSGIALAAILLGGPRMWPGVFWGALLVNGWTPWFNAPSTWAAIGQLLAPISISLGATAQALLGGYLIRRTVGFPNPLVHDRQILVFLTLGGPVACLLGATWGVTTLALVGTLHGVASVAVNWFHWWVGDVIGVIIFAPLTLIGFARPRKLWRPRWISVALPLLIAIVATVSLLVLTQVLDKSHSHDQFQRIATHAHQQLDTQIDRHLAWLDSMQRYFAYSQYINRDEFAKFNESSHHRCPATTTLAWIPWASDQDEGNTGNALTGEERERGGTRAFAVNYLHPPQSSMLSIGQDLTSHPRWQALLRHCLATQSRVASEPFFPEQAPGVPHVIVLSPVYRPVASRSSQRAKHSGSPAELAGKTGDHSDESGHALEVPGQSVKCLGFLAAILDVEMLVRQASLLQSDYHAYQLTMWDQTDPNAAKVLLNPEESRSAHKQTEVVSLLQRNEQYSGGLWFVDRSWFCHYTPTPMFHAHQANSYSSIILASGLAMSAILGSFLLLLSGRTARIQASEARYLDLYEHAPDMFLSVDVDSQRVVECNRTFLESTGLAKPSVIDQPMHSLFATESQDEAKGAFERFLHSGQVSDVELKLKCSDGSVIETSLKMTGFREQAGHTMICRAALRDITARKQVEADMKAQEMELAHVGRLSMMGEMATGLAHEINQPLAAIAAYAEGASIRLREGTPDPSSLGIVLDRIAQDAHRAGQVIRRLRQFLRKRPPERTEVRVNDVVREVLQFVDADLKRRDIRLETDLTANLPSIQGDPVQIQQVLLNLVRNGCDAMENTEACQRLLTLRTRCCDDDNVEVTVTDRGHGLSASPNDQLFDAFFSTKDDGLGMGLAISRSIIESHGGQIWATSNPQGGASFRFSLPSSKQVCPT